MKNYNARGLDVLTPAGVVVAHCATDYYAQRVATLLNWWDEALMRQPWGEKYTTNDIERAMADSLAHMVDHAPPAPHPNLTIPIQPRPGTLTLPAVPKLPPIPVVLP